VGEGDAVSAAVVSTGELRELVNSFLIYESDLADHHLVKEWLELWSSDGIYWVPCNEDDYDPRRHVSIIYDDYERLQERVYRLSSDSAHAQDPQSRLCRIIGNLRVSRATPTSNLVEVGANMMLVEVRAGEKNVYGARLEYKLEPDGNTFKIKQKKVILLDNDEPLGNLTFIL
jgi:benzoate/toluate 1,2-dioxygenase subunit beta